MLGEEKLEPILCPDSYRYRPGRSAHDALAVARKRCWNKDWVLDLDVGAFFDSVGHDLLMKAVAHHTDERWVLLYIQRWLKAPMTMADGTTAPREIEPHMGSPISPLLANLFMHYGFDKWMDREHPGCPFERYADDVVIHCDTEQQAQQLCADLAARLGSLGLELHPDKTKIVYCKDTNRRDEAQHTSFDFLGYTFCGRRARGRRGLLRELLTSGEPQGEQGDRQTDQGLAPQPSQCNGPRRTRRGHQRPDPRLVQLLRGLLPPASCMPSQRASTNISFDGRCRSSNDCEANPPKRGDGSTLPVSASHNSSLTGTSSLQPNAELREPYDGRLSRTVLTQSGRGRFPPATHQARIAGSPISPLSARARSPSRWSRSSGRLRSEDTRPGATARRRAPSPAPVRQASCRHPPRCM